MNHICGQCGKKFATEKDYLGHVCEKTGVTPRTLRTSEADSKPYKQLLSREEQPKRLKSKSKS
jgi:predicted  nucleic acid-binding Zn-ribbon protein